MCDLWCITWFVYCIHTQKTIYLCIHRVDRCCWSSQYHTEKIRFVDPRQQLPCSMNDWSRQSTVQELTGGYDNKSYHTDPPTVVLSDRHGRGAHNTSIITSM